MYVMHICVELEDIYVIAKKNKKKYIKTLHYGNNSKIYKNYHRNRDNINTLNTHIYDLIHSTHIHMIQYTQHTYI
jgi:hypothetical protein